MERTATLEASTSSAPTEITSSFLSVLYNLRSFLSSLTPDRFAYAVCTEDVKALSRAPGIGSKTAARIVLELKDKISKDQMQGNLSSLTDSAAVSAPVDKGVLKEAADALTVLGYSRSEVNRVLGAIDPAGKTLEGIITEALRRFTKG